MNCKNSTLPIKQCFSSRSERCINPFRSISILLICCLVLPLLAACGRSQIKDLPPLVRLSQVELNGDEHIIKIRIENPNDVPFHAEELRFGLALDEAEVAYDGEAHVDIVPHSAEEVALKINLSEATINALEMLESGAGLNWVIEGVLPQIDARDWPFRARGVIYPVPGVASVYRASATGSAYPIQRSR